MGFFVVQLRTMVPANLNSKAFLFALQHIIFNWDLWQLHT